MKARPRYDRCNICGEVSIMATGYMLSIQGWLAGSWPAWGGDFDDVAGPMHISCMRTAGLGPALTASRRRHKIEEGATHELLSDELLFVGTRRTGVQVVIDGASLEIPGRKIEGVLRTGTYTERYLTGYDLLGEPPALAARIKAAIDDGPITLEHLHELLELHWHGLPHPVEALTVATRGKDTERGFRIDAFEAHSFTAYRLDERITSILATLDQALFDF